MARRNVAKIGSRRGTAGKAKVVKKAPKKKPAKGRTRVDAQDAVKELAEMKFWRWLENTFAVYGNRDGWLVTLEGCAGEGDVLTREEFLLLEPGDLTQGLDELASVREILDGMIEQVREAQELVS